MVRNFMDPPLPLFVQEDCALMHASRFCHCIPLVELVFKTATRPALFQINSLNIHWTIFTTLCSVAPLTSDGGSSNNSCKVPRLLCCALAHWPSDYMDVLSRFRNPDTVCGLASLFTTGPKLDRCPWCWIVFAHLEISCRVNGAG